MTRIPPFLTRLGLDASADERTVRRAYAQQLKAIDPAEDPRGFQSLRESYEAALAWAKRGRPRTPQVIRDAAATDEILHGAFPRDPSAEEPTPLFGSLTQMPTPPLTPNEPESSNLDSPKRLVEILSSAEPDLQPIPAGPPLLKTVSAPRTREKIAKQSSRPPSPQNLAKSIFSVLQARANTWSTGSIGRGEGRAQAELEYCLRDPRLLNLVARRLFEQMVVDHLARDPEPGRKALLAASARTFGWIRDRRRLEQFGPSGQKLNQEIDSTSLIVLEVDASRWAPVMRQWRYYRARKKRVRLRARPKKKWLWWIVWILIYSLFAIFNNLNH